jgi:hypothetical protein
MLTSSPKILQAKAFVRVPAIKLLKKGGLRHQEQ